MTQERRRAPRYRIEATITVDDAKGRTIDLSSNGVLFETAQKFVTGDRVALVFPFERSDPGASVNCSAEVVRVEPRGALFGVAATYEPVSFSVAG